MTFYGIWFAPSLRMAHRVGRSGIGRRVLRCMYHGQEPRLSMTVAGLKFPRPVGLATGFDKNGIVVEAMAALRFSHVEIDSISAAPSDENPRPRLFRLVEEEAIVVNEGVPNEGAEIIAQRLAKTPIECSSGCQYRRDQHRLADRSGAHRISKHIHKVLSH